MASAEAANASLEAAVAAATATLDRIKPPPGVIMPPPGEMREVIEKTVGYAVRGGSGIEARLRENHSNNPKFSFVTNADDPFHAYYEWRKAEYRAGRVTAVASGRVADAIITPTSSDAAGTNSANAPAKGPERPPDFAFSARLPIMNARDIDVLRLAASFAAIHGRVFLTTLLQREVSNPQFQFLLPNHSLHGYFQRMIDQYAIIHKDLGLAVPSVREDAEMTDAGDDNLQQNGDREATPTADSSATRLAILHRNVDNRSSILLRAKQRVAYAAWEEAQRKKEEHEHDLEQEELSRIDWTTFTVLETIVFDANDEAAITSLPPPTSLNDLQYASLEEKSKLSMSTNRMIEEAFPF